MNLKDLETWNGGLTVSGVKKMVAVGFNFDRSKKKILYEIGDGNMGKDINGKWKRYTTIELCNDIWQAGLKKPKPRHYPVRTYPGCYICGVQHKSDKLGTDDVAEVTCKNCLAELGNLGQIKGLVKEDVLKLAGKRKEAGHGESL